MSGVRSTALRLSVLTALVSTAVFGASPAQAEPCQPGVDPDCSAVVVTNFPEGPDLSYVIAYIDDRQFGALLFLTAVTAALTLAQFVWRASGSLRLGGHK